MSRKTRTQIPNDYSHVMLKDSAGNKRQGLKIYCSECTNSEAISINTEHDMPQTFADRRFRGKGWVIGRNRKHDVCPACLAKTASHRALSSPVVITVAPEPKPQAQTEAPIVDMKPPTNLPVVSKPTPAIRRRIMEGIEAGTVTDCSAYRPGITDEIIATKLNVPRQWVAEVRETMFDFTDGSAALDELKVTLEELDARLTRVSNDSVGFIKLIEDLDREVRTIRNEIRVIRKKVGL